MLKHLVVSTCEGETSSNEVIQVDIDPPPVSNIQLVHEPQAKPGFVTEIDNVPKVSDGVHDYCLVHDKEHRQTKPPERYGYEDLGAYAILTRSRYSSTSREAITS